MFCLCVVISRKVRGSRWEERFDLRSIVPRAHRPKGRRALVRVRRDDEPRTVVGILKRRERPRAPDARPAASRRRANPPEPFPQSLPPQEPITNTQCPGYRTAQPSDSPPWASRYASRAGTGRVRGAEPGPLRAHKGPQRAAIQSLASEPRADSRRRRRSRLRRVRGSPVRRPKEAPSPPKRVRPNAPSSQNPWCPPSVRSAALFMVAAAARRQGTSP